MSGCNHDKCLRDGCKTCCYCGAELKQSENVGQGELRNVKALPTVRRFTVDAFDEDEEGDFVLYSEYEKLKGHKKEEVKAKIMEAICCGPMNELMDRLNKALDEVL